MKELIGKKVVAINVNQDQILLKFTTDIGEDIIYAAEGDCCSETWWADIVFSGRKPFPFTVLTEGSIEFPMWADKIVNSDGKSRQDYDQVYGQKLKTDAGCVEFIYRNSSNGYYGGDYSLVDIQHTYYQRALNSAEWTSITGDWNASNGMEN